MSIAKAPFIAANSIFAGLSVIQLKIASALTAVSVEAITGIFTKTAHGLTDNQGVEFVSGTGFTGLTAAERYYVKYLTANTFKLMDEPDGTVIVPTLAGSDDGLDGVFQPLHIYEAAKLEDDPESEMKYLDRPDARGRLRHARGVETKAFEKWMFDLDEVKRVLEIFSGKMRGRKNGTCTLWIPDPDDATGKVALKSEADFPVIVSRDGKITHGDSNFSKAVIKIESSADDDVSWTKDAVA